MNQQLTLAYSPCPNDTFIFYALAHRKIDCKGLSFSIELADVETLNHQASRCAYDVTKLSFAALGNILDRYCLLRSGAAIGKGCGPLIVARPGTDPARMDQEPIAVPGLWTTAALLLGLYRSKTPNRVPIPFDQIMPRVANGEFSFGVIIHEGRFTYSSYGLEQVVDLGQWWEKYTSLPIPLGGIAIRRSMPVETAEKVESLIRESVEYAFAHEDETADYIQQHAQEMSRSVIRQHIELYVNNYTIRLGNDGETAIQTLFRMGVQSGMLTETAMPLFRN